MKERDNSIAMKENSLLVLMNRVFSLRELNTIMLDWLPLFCLSPC